ncbi:MAG: haloacid dehalogenase superfamily [Eubacterium sp.]|jgi:phosphoglycolate phosphatase|nr:haloacid dehalogenase superfamily [Eubacterium sp.]
MRYETVLFDLDGTLLDTSEGIVKGVEHTLKLMGLPLLSSEQCKTFIGPPVLNSFIRECSMSEAAARSAVEIYRKRYKEKGLYQSKKYKNIKQLLVNLKKNNCKISIATLKREDFAKTIMNHFGLFSYFDSIRGIDQNDSLTKKDIIVSCLEDLKQIDYSKAVFIGDSEYDAEGAREAGIDFIPVTYGFGFKNEVEADRYSNVFIAKNPKSLSDYLLA